MHIRVAVEIDLSTKVLIQREIEPVKAAHPEYQWYVPSHYRVPLLSLPTVDDDLVPKLQSKIEELTVDVGSHVLFGHEYAVKIAHDIDVYLMLQDHRIYTTLAQSLHEYFIQTPYRPKVPMIHVAHYKIPSKQQYSHLKNQLAKIDTSVEIPVTRLTLTQVTFHGRGSETSVEKGIVELG